MVSVLLMGCSAMYSRTIPQVGFGLDLIELSGRVADREHAELLRLPTYLVPARNNRRVTLD
jgi:hypothetical protein